MKYLPCKELTAILLPAYTACAGKVKSCPCGRGLDPANGYIPRGFGGGLGKLSEIALILVTAEPGNPERDGSQRYESKIPIKLIEESGAGFFGAVHEADSEERTFHGSIKMILNECWPDLKGDLEKQLKRTWITPSVLCSADLSCGPIPQIQEQTCAEKFLRLQLQALPNRFVVALGGKAERRMRAASLPVSFPASAAGKPECLKDRARQSWIDVGKAFRSHLRALR